MNYRVGWGSGSRCLRSGRFGPVRRWRLSDGYTEAGMSLEEDLAQARRVIAEQEEQIACLRELVLELSGEAERDSALAASDPARLLALLRSSERGDGPGEVSVRDWSSPFDPERLVSIRPVDRLDDLSTEWAWGGSSGRGVRVALIDS